MASTAITQEFETVFNMSEDELYEHLGMASLGTESVGEAMESFQMLKSMGASTDSFEVTRSFESLREKGKRKFEKLWDSLNLKDFVCEIYRGGHAIGDKKDLGAYIVGLLISAGKIVNPLASILVAIAVKRGLDKLCPAT